MAFEKITKLRLYKGGGSFLEFKLGDETIEGTITRISYIKAPNFFKIEYSNGTHVGIQGFPYTVHMIG